MKKTITIIIIVILAVGLGYFLFKISPEESTGLPSSGSLDIGDVEQVSEPRPIGQSDHILGRAEAKNILIVYDDLQCPACAYYEPILSQLQAELQDTKLVFRHFPLPTLHQNAVISAFSAEAAAAQGKFWEYTTALYERQGEWENLANPLDKFAEIASGAGISDIERFKKDVQSEKYKDKIEADLKEALGLNLRGTPTLIFNGQQLELGTAEQIKQQAENYYQ